MTDCCNQTKKPTHSKKRNCPNCGNACAEVSVRTISHHISRAWEWENNSQNYYFCDAPNCDVAYFGEDDSVILQSQLRTAVGVKSSNELSLLCYCFGVTQADAQRSKSIRDFVVAKTKLGLCSCETSNPSGRCCLKDFPRNHDTEYIKVCL